MAVIVLGTYGLRIRADRAARRHQAVLQGRIADLDSKMKVLEDKCLGLARQAISQSNRADLAMEKYEEERKTNEPLRRQIEKMIAQAIKYESRIEKNKSEIRRQRESLSKAGKEIEKLKTDNRSLTRKLEELRAKLVQAEKHAAEVEKQLQESVTAQP